jgi:hypothetical protein
MKRLLHLGAWGRNYGDRAIQWAMREAIGADCSVVPFDCQRTQWTTVQQAEAVNRDYDAILVGGGGLLWDKPELQSVSGWQWQVTPDFLEALRIPVVVWGIGWTAFPTLEDWTGKHPAFAPTVGWLAEHAAAFTVRNPETRDHLAALGIQTDRVQVVADPALGAPWEPWRGGSDVLALCWASDKQAWRWTEGTRGEAVALHAVAAAASALGLRIRVVPHIAGLDERIATMLRLWGARVENLEATCPDLYPASCERVREWASAAYGDARVVVSMRKHGVLIPAGMGAPVVGLGQLAEVGHLARQIGVPMIHEGDDADTVLHLIRDAKPVAAENVTWARQCNALLAETLAGITGGDRDG